MPFPNATARGAEGLQQELRAGPRHLSSSQRKVLRNAGAVLLLLNRGYCINTIQKGQDYCFQCGYIAQAWEFRKDVSCPACGQIAWDER